MKKTVSALLACVLLIGCLLTLVSCGKSITGSYKAELLVSNVTYEFEMGGKVTKITDPFVGNNTTEEGEYKFNDDGNEITLTFGGESSTHEYVEGEEGGVKYIKLDGVKYEKID